MDKIHQISHKVFKFRPRKTDFELSTMKKNHTRRKIIPVVHNDNYGLL